jgi:hypothetical protein
MRADGAEHLPGGDRRCAREDGVGAAGERGWLEYVD